MKDYSGLLSKLALLGKIDCFCADLQIFFEDNVQAHGRKKQL